jgi:hypothetical protein
MHFLLFTTMALHGGKCCKYKTHCCAWSCLWLSGNEMQVDLNHFMLFVCMCLSLLYIKMFCKCENFHCWTVVCLSLSCLFNEYWQYFNNLYEGVNVQLTVYACCSWGMALNISLIASSCNIWNWKECVEVTLRLMVSQSVYLGVGHPFWAHDQILLFPFFCRKIALLFISGHPLWREDGSVICSAICQWSSRGGLITIHYCLILHYWVPIPSPLTTRQRNVGLRKRVNSIMTFHHC